MAETDLDAIRKKVRRITRSPSTAQLSNADLDEYINTFVLYDFPENLRTFTLREQFTFFTEPNVDTYDSSNTDFDPNIYISVHPPLYIAGYESTYSQSETEFYRNYPLTNEISQIGTGDGATVLFSGTLTNIPVLQNQVLFSSIDGSNGGLQVNDDGAGNLTGDGTGTINYVTGVYSFTFDTAPGVSEEVFSQTRPYVASRPYGLLFFQNKFILRPVPDKVYRVEIDVYKRPTELLSANQSPELNQWWQYIALGAARKIFEDKLDMASLTQLLPIYKEQEALVIRRTADLLSNQRSATIYTENVQQLGGFGSPGGLY